MSDYRAAYRYALALLSVADEAKQLDEVHRDVTLVEKLANESRDFMLFLKSPIVNHEKKKKIFAELFHGKVGAVTEKFLLLLASKGREGLLPQIIREFYKLRDERLGILEVTTRTATTFTPEQEARLIRQLELATRKKIRLAFVFDPALKGGFKVQHDDTVWDASVLRQLEVLRDRFMEGPA